MPYNHQAENRKRWAACERIPVSMFSTCEDVPIPSPFPITKKPQTNDNSGDKLVRLENKSIRGVIRMVKNQHLQWLQARKASMEAQHVRQERELVSISDEMVKMAHDDFVAAKRRQQLHENSTELRDLEMELRKARATIMLEKQQDNMVHEREQETEASRKEAADLRERIKRERDDEHSAHKNKRSAFRAGLIEQIAEHRQQDREQVKKLALEHERMIENQRKELLHDSRAKEAALECKRAQKKDLDDFMKSQMHYKKLNAVVDVHDVGILQSMHPATIEKLRKIEEARKDKIKRRQERSNIIGAQIKASKELRSKHEDLIIDLLVKEFKANEDKAFKETIEKEYKKKLTAQQDLLLQRSEDRMRQQQRLYYEKKYRPQTTETSFYQREYRSQDALQQRLRQGRMQNCNDLVLMIEERKLRRAELDEENRQFVTALEKEYQDREKVIKRERMDMLRREPIKVLAALRNGVLNSEEKRELGVKEGLRNRYDYA